MVCLPEQSSFDYEFDYGSQFVNMSYTGRFYFLEPEDYVSIIGKELNIVLVYDGRARMEMDSVWPNSFNFSLFIDHTIFYKT